MTLLEMIKKYEGIKKKMHMVQQKEDEEIVEAILEDLRSIKDDIDVQAVKFKVLRLINRELDNSNFEDVRNLAQAMHLLSLPD